MNGYIALVSAIIISAVLLMLILGSSFTGFRARFNILDSETKEQSVALAEACVEAALLKLTQDIAYAGNENISVGNKQCHIGTVSATQIETQAQVADSYTRLRVILNITIPPTVNRWTEY